MAQNTAVLGVNQGAYNAFFAVGLLVALLFELPEGQAEAVIVFCLASLAAAGLVGLLTVRRWVFLVQMVPPLLALGLMAGG
jgi:putative membrane protein